MSLDNDYGRNHANPPPYGSEWGDAIPCEFDLAKVNDALRKMAKVVLPPRTRFEIRGNRPEFCGGKVSFGRAWYRCDEMDDAPEWDVGLLPCAVYVPDHGGYYLFGRFITPDCPHCETKPSRCRHGHVSTR